MDSGLAYLLAGALVLLFLGLFALLTRMERREIAKLVTGVEDRLTRELKIQKTATAVLSRAIVKMGGSVTPEKQESTGKWALTDDDEDEE